MTVKRGAVCNTDHHLVVATMKFRYKSRARKMKTKRYDVGKLLNEEVERQEMCDRYLNEVLERTDEACKDDEDVAERWDIYSPCCSDNSSRECVGNNNTTAARLVPGVPEQAETTSQSQE